MIFRSFLPHRALPRRLRGCMVALGARAAPQPPVPIERVIASGRGDASGASTIGALRSSKTTYALRGSDFGKLREAGVSDTVLDHVQQQFIDDADLLTRYWVLGESVGGCARCLPLEVDLSDMDAPRMHATSTVEWADRPQGMPSWYRPYFPRRSEVTLLQIEEMARNGASEAEMLERLRGSRLEGVAGVGGIGTVRTHPVAGVTGSELADLRSAGVPDAVLDAVQALFLAQYVELARLRYQNLGKGPAGTHN